MSMAFVPVHDRVVALPQRARPSGPRGGRAGEALLADALDREARAPQGRIAVVVRLSRLPAPGARPYHRRVARALLDDCAQRHGGQVIRLGSGDLVLVTTLPPGAVREAADGPLALPGLLVRLLHAEDHDGMDRIAFAVKLAEGEAQLRSLAEESGPAEREEETGGRRRNPFAGRLTPGFAPLAPDALRQALAGGVTGLLQLQCVARLPSRGSAGDGPAPIRAVLRVLAPAPAQVAARLAALQGSKDAPGADLPLDPWLRQHVEAELGRALLGLVRRCWGDATPVDASPRAGAPPMLLRLPLGVLAGEDFAAFAALPHGDPPPSVAVGIAEAAADAQGFAAARTALRAAGMALVLEGVTHHALVLARPEAFAPDFVSLGWSAALARLPAGRLAEVEAAVARIGPERMILSGADGEAAVRWGRTMGIRLFQGAHVEAMLAATRLLVCPHAAACGLRACTERGIAASALGRAGCARPELLDQGAAEAAAAARRIIA